MKLLLVVVALVALAATRVQADDIDKLLLPTQNDAKDTTDSEILNAVKGRTDDASEKDDDLSDEVLDLADLRHVAHTEKKQKKKTEKKKKKTLKKNMPAPTADVPIFKKRDQTYQPIVIKLDRKEIEDAAMADLNLPTRKSNNAHLLNAHRQGYSRGERKLLDSYEYDWHEMERQGMSRGEVDALIAKSVANDYLSKEEKALLKHYGYNFRILEEGHVPRDEIDERLRLMIAKEHGVDLSATEAATTKAPTTETPSTAAVEEENLLDDHTKKVLTDFGYDWRKIEQMNLPPAELERLLMKEAISNEKQIAAKMEQRIRDGDNKVTTEYRSELNKALSKIQEVKQLEEDIADKADKIRSSGTTYIKNIREREKETADQLRLDVEEKLRQIDEMAAKAKTSVVQEDKAKWDQVYSASETAIKKASETVRAEEHKAEEVAVAAKNWYYNEEVPFLKGLQARMAAKDKALRHQARVKAEYRMMQIEKDVPVGGSWVDKVQ